MKEAALGTYSLLCHPAKPALEVTRVDVRWQVLPAGRLMLRWQVSGAARVVVPPFAGRGRADGLWQATCFELFLKGDGPAYREFNFSPSQRWAAYAFSDYREAAGEAAVPEAPEISCAKGEAILAFTAMMPASILDGASHAGLCAVIEEDGGHLSYWALAHTPGPPDFHRAECFTAAIMEASAP